MDEILQTWEDPVHLLQSLMNRNGEPSEGGNSTFDKFWDLARDRDGGFSGLPMMPLPTMHFRLVDADGNEIKFPVSLISDTSWSRSRQAR